MNYDDYQKDNNIYVANVGQQRAVKTKKKGTGKKIMKGACVLLAVACVGTAGGFGGSVLYNNLNPVAVQEPSQSLNYSTTVNTDTGNDASALSVSQIAEKTQPSVVEITTEVVSNGQFMQSYVGSGAGSGVIISEDGYIVTNNHVIEGATKITVKTISGESYEAELVGTDEQTDLAVLKVDATGLYAATIGSSSELAVGDYVMAIGNPLGEFGGTVSDGIVSALSREITIEGETMTLLQTNAAINPGNSGGGLFNENGELVAIVNAKSSGVEIEGIGFAIPMDIAIDVIEDLIDVGYVQGRFTLGVSLVDIQDEMTAMMYGIDTAGLYVQALTQGGNAHLAGMQVGDRFVEFNGAEIATYDDLLAEMEKLESGQTVEAIMERDGKLIILSVTLNEQKADSAVAVGS